MTAALARRHGASVRQPRVQAGPVRELEAVAVENAVEGCVGETLGALLAMAQAHAAQSADIRAAMASVAVDETRHAALAWAIAAWADSKLESRARDKIAEAKRAAVDELRRQAALDPPPSLMAAAGLPSAERARLLVRELDRGLWAS